MTDSRRVSGKVAAGKRRSVRVVLELTFKDARRLTDRNLRDTFNSDHWYWELLGETACRVQILKPDDLVLTDVKMTPAPNSGAAVAYGVVPND